MDRERLTVSDALDSEDTISQFISNGLETPSATDNADDSNETSSRDAGDSDQVRSASSPRARKKKDRPSEPREISDEQLSRTFAKSVIQKTVRFKPTLIARLEGWLRHQELSDHPQKTFQQIQNEALELWLDQKS